MAAVDPSSSSTLPRAAAAAADHAIAQATAETAPPSTTATSDAPESAPQTVDAPSREDEMRTVFQDPTNFNVKHPLYSSWTLWFDNPSKGGFAPKGSKDSWGDDMSKVISFDSVEEFWGLYHNIIPPSMFGQKANYYLFKEGIRPAWEDPANTEGGKWSIQLPREKFKGSIDKTWLFTMLAAIGETFEANHTPSPNDDGLITGVIVSARANFYRVSIWTRAADDELRDRLETIGRHFKTQVLGFQVDQKLGSGLLTDVEFQSHKESEKKKGKRWII